MSVRLSVLMGQREIHRTGSHGIYLGILLQLANTFLYRTKISTLYEDLRNFLTFCHYWSYN
jgi:hypothetical protein